MDRASSSRFKNSQKLHFRLRVTYTSGHHAMEKPNRERQKSTFFFREENKNIIFKNFRCLFFGDNKGSCVLEMVRTVD